MCEVRNLGVPVWKTGGVLKNFKEANEFSKRYRFPIDFSTGYDAYLKINKQASGIRSYNEMVRLVIAYELQLKK
jgi:hypothetical protein